MLCSQPQRWVSSTSLDSAAKDSRLRSCGMQGEAYLRVRSALELSRSQNIIVKTVPFGEELLGMRLISVIPFEHAGMEIDACPLAKLFDHGLWLVQQIIGIDNSQLALIYKSCLHGVVEKLDELFVSHFAGPELVKPANLVQRRDTAPPVGRDRPARVADEECKLEFFQTMPWDDGWVACFLAATEGACNLGIVLVFRGREKIVCHVFDEDSFPLSVFVVSSS